MVDQVTATATADGILNSITHARTARDIHSAEVAALAEQQRGENVYMQRQETIRAEVDLEVERNRVAQIEADNERQLALLRGDPTATLNAEFSRALDSLARWPSDCGCNDCRMGRECNGEYEGIVSSTESSETIRDTVDELTPYTAPRLRPRPLGHRAIPSPIVWTARSVS